MDQNCRKLCVIRPHWEFLDTTLRSLFEFCPIKNCNFFSMVPIKMYLYFPHQEMNWVTFGHLLSSILQLKIPFVCSSWLTLVNFQSHFFGYNCLSQLYWLSRVTFTLALWTTWLPPILTSSSSGFFSSLDGFSRTFSFSSLTSRSSLTIGRTTAT